MARRTSIYQDTGTENYNYFRNETDDRTIAENYEQLQKEILDSIYKYREEKEKSISRLEKDLGFKNADEQEKFHVKMKKQMDKAVLAEDIKNKKKALQELAEWEAGIRQEIANSTIKEIMEAAEVSKREARRMRNEARKENFKKEWEDSSDDFKDKILDKLSSSLDRGVDQALSMYADYQGKINSRLDGTQKTFKQFMDASDKMSPFYKVQDYAKNLNALVDEGVAYNVEQRAFLMTMSDKLVSTFNAADATLLRIVRMQASDSTAIRMGMEASLNEYMNIMYKNTEYLKHTYDDVTKALVEAESTMRSATASAEFEYVVQKWLGSLTSTGMSESTATEIASAIGKLGSGDISMLGTGVGNLITMAAARAGMSIGDMLTGGINANLTDQLMESVVDFMQEWGASTNNVVRSQIAGLFGVNVSDLVSSLNLDTSTVTGNMLTSNQALGKLSQKMSAGFSWDSILSGEGYVALSEAVSNLFSNAVMSLGTAIADSPLQLGTYQAARFIGDFTKDLGSVGGIISDVANIAKFAVATSAGIENLYEIWGTKTAGFGFNLLNTFNRLGDLSLGANYTGQSISATVTSSGQIVAAQGSTDMETVRAQAKEDAATEQKLNRAPLEIQEYLLNTFDQKFDALVRLTAASANYSVQDRTGVRIGDTVIDSLLGTSSVRIVAEPADTTEIDLTNEISVNVANIYSLLQKIVTGEASVATRQINAISQAVSQYGEVYNYITSTIAG